MVDTERAASVQTLRALFSQQPVMGVLPSPKVSRVSLTTPGHVECNPDIQNSDSLPDLGEKSDVNANAISQNTSSPVWSIEKPPIKPKPTVSQRSSPCNGHSAVRIMVATLDREQLASKSSSNSSISSRSESLDNLKDQVCDKKQAVGSSNESISSKNGISVKLVKKETVFSCDEKALDQDMDSDVQSNSVEIERAHLKKKDLPSVTKLGPAPLKPSLPIEVEEKYRSLRMSRGPQPPPLPRRNTLDATVILPERPSGLPRPNRMSAIIRSPPSRPPPAPPVAVTPTTAVDVEELYGDTVDVHQLERSNSLIPEYTEEDELGKRNYSPPPDIPPPPSHPPPARPKLPPPPPPTLSSTGKLSPSSPTQEDVNGLSNLSDQELYEAMPAAEQQGPIYSNTKEQEKQQREQQKQMRKEQKEREKKERESEKEKKKFGLTGEEIPVYIGCVKNDSRGGRNDLTVHKGEIVLILRIEKNPSGKWLAKNEKGKRGYVELTNIEVDADSVKSVMKSRMSLSSDDVYSDVKSEEPEEEESLYECTF